jgi:hypothetical protein
VDIVPPSVIQQVSTRACPTRQGITLRRTTSFSLAATASRLSTGLQGTRDAVHSKQKEANMGYGLVGILLIILLVVLIVYFVRRA